MSEDKTILKKHVDQIYGREKESDSENSWKIYLNCRINLELDICSSQRL